MMTDLEQISKYIEARRDRILAANDAIHDLAELSYEETRSAKVLTDILREEGFRVEEGLAGMPTCFTGTWGEGSPVMGILGEFDALDKLSQEPGNPVKTPLVEGAPGHGCGHCCLGTGALGAAILLKKYLEEREKEVVNIMIELFNQEYAVKQYGKAMEEKGFKKGFEKGFEKGLKKGMKKGKAQMAQLIAKLFDLGKIEDLEKVSKDPEYREKLLKDYGLAKA